MKSSHSNASNAGKYLTLATVGCPHKNKGQMEARLHNLKFQRYRKLKTLSDMHSKLYTKACQNLSD